MHTSSQLFKRWIELSTGQNLHPVDNAIDFPNTCPLDSDLAGGYRYPTLEILWPGVVFYSRLNHQAPVVQKVDSAIHGINLYPPDSDLSGG